MNAFKCKASIQILQCCHFFLPQYAPSTCLTCHCNGKKKRLVWHTGNIMGRHAIKGVVRRGLGKVGMVADFSCHLADGLVQDCGISSALALEIPESYTKPYIHDISKGCCFERVGVGRRQVDRWLGSACLTLDMSATFRVMCEQSHYHVRDFFVYGMWDMWMFQARPNIATQGRHFWMYFSWRIYSYFHWK